MARPRTAYLGTDLPDDQLRVPPALGAGAMLRPPGDPSFPGAEATIATGETGSELASNEDAAGEEAYQLIMERAIRYMGLTPQEAARMTPEELAAGLAEGYPDDVDLQNALATLGLGGVKTGGELPPDAGGVGAEGMSFRPDPSVPPTRY